MRYYSSFSNSRSWNERIHRLFASNLFIFRYKSASKISNWFKFRDFTAYHVYGFSFKFHDLALNCWKRKLLKLWQVIWRNWFQLNVIWRFLLKWWIIRQKADFVEMRQRINFESIIISYSSLDRKLVKYNSETELKNSKVT